MTCMFDRFYLLWYSSLLGVWKTQHMQKKVTGKFEPFIHPFIGGRLVMCHMRGWTVPTLCWCPEQCSRKKSILSSSPSQDFADTRGKTIEVAQRISDPISGTQSSWKPSTFRKQSTNIDFSKWNLLVHGCEVVSQKTTRSLPGLLGGNHWLQ